ncbi:MAG: hypothetical protein N2049_03160 [Anaerolineales bacterium]|nr:hypothetical protein [Anaerolineales bacterium]
MNDRLYHLLVGLLDIFAWGGELIGEENLPKKGPAVLVANHLNALGPIACFCSIPLRLYSWTISDMLDPQKAAAYLNMDFTERQLGLKPPWSLWLSRLLVRITVPLLRSLGCIPVYRGDYGRMQETFRLSLQRLREEKCLLIFPEDNLLPAEPQTGMRMFWHTFVRLGELWYKETGQALGFYPIAIHPTGKIQVGNPVFFNPLNRAGWERKRITEILEMEIRRMYLELAGESPEMLGLKPAPR